MQESKALWWQKGVIYQIYPRSFQDSNADGIGDLQGVINRLDYLAKTLGVDAIWLSPFYPSPQADFGYDVADYRDVDPMYGNLELFDHLIREAHQRGLKVIIDIVPNHTSDQHPWFQESRSSRENPKRNWYTWQDAKNDGSLPNNWLSNFGGPSWEWDEKTSQYYLHSFLKVQPDLNWRNPQVREAMFAVYRFWLDRGVDGFRIDVAHYIMKDPELKDNPLNLNPANIDWKQNGAYDTLYHLYDKGHPDVHGVYQELRKILDSYDPPRYSVGEIHIFEWEQWASYFGKNNDELHMPFNFALLVAPWKADAIRKIVENIEKVTPQWGWPNYVLGNHDEPRIAGKLGETKARQAAMLLLTLRGTPTIYNGDEFGQTNVAIPPELEKDPWGKRVPGSGRDKCRTPNQWTAGENAGFALPGITPWLPVAEDYKTVNMEFELEESKSMLNLYRRLLAFRKKSAALHSGTLKIIDLVPENCFANLRSYEDEKIVLAFNFGETTARLNLQSLGNFEIIVSTGMDRFGLTDSSRIDLSPAEGLVLRVI
jgi:alpha-glucosidase